MVREDKIRWKNQKKKCKKAKGRLYFVKSIVVISLFGVPASCPYIRNRPAGWAGRRGGGSLSFMCARARSSSRTNREKHTDAGARTHIRARSPRISGLYHWNRKLIKFPIKSPGRDGLGEPSEWANFPTPTGIITGIIFSKTKQIIFVHIYYKY